MSALLVGYHNLEARISGSTLMLRTEVSGSSYNGNTLRRSTIILGEVLSKSTYNGCTLSGSTTKKSSTKWDYR